MQISQVNPFNYPIIYYTMKDKSWVLAKWPDYEFDVIFQILREVWRVINILFSFFKLSLLTHWTKISPLFTYVPSFSSLWLGFLALIHVVTTFNTTLNFVCTVVTDFKSKEGTKTNLAISHIKLAMMKSSP